MAIGALLSVWHTTAQNYRRMLLTRVTLAALISTILFGCATNDPLRSAGLAWDGNAISARPASCTAAYFKTDALIWQEIENQKTDVGSRATLNQRIDRMIAPQLNGANPDLSECWKTSYEDHQNLYLPGDSQTARNPPPGYDLLIAEFDDQGERTDVSRAGVPFRTSEVSLIEAQLNTLLNEELRKNRDGGLNVVVFTHGWHGSALATDDYSIWFKAILEEITYLEATSRRSLCASSFQALSTVPSRQRRQIRARRANYGCSDDETTFVPRRTVGIEIAWRGDSEVVPFLTWANFWDRKSAAQTIAQGAVQDLISRVHAFYIAHSCHSHGATHTPSHESESCDAVHLLTIGHSFGALIDYHSLNGDLSTGILGDRAHRAYGFGDLTVLLNPAFEGEREVNLWQTALNRKYLTKLESPSRLPQNEEQPGAAGAQMPVLVTLQSKGDWATHYVFPPARFISSAFENTPGAGEYARSLKAAGWVALYQTHTLSPGRANTRDRCVAADSNPRWFCPFDTIHNEKERQPLILRWTGPQHRPAFLPLWTVAVDKSIMNGHDDISNPLVVRFIAKLFRAAYEQSEFIHEAARRRHL